MNYDEPRQLESTKLWHYTRRNDNKIWPIGYCSSVRTCPECNGSSAWGHGAPAEPGQCEKCLGRGVIAVDPCPGHETADEARAHYREYLLAETLRLDGEYADIQRRCIAPVGNGACGVWTSKFAEIDRPSMGPTFDLCDEHRTREVVEVLFPRAYDSIHS